MPIIYFFPIYLFLKEPVPGLLATGVMDRLWELDKSGPLHFLSWDLEF